MAEHVTSYPNRHQQFLQDLKSTLEGLLVGQVTNVWFVYGGLNRLHSAMEKIFKQGCKIITSDNSLGYWKFIEGLDWLQPNSTLTIDCEYKPHMPQHLKQNKASIWLFSSLESHSLSMKLSWLLSDKAHLTACYQSDAFLCQKEYAESVLICLRAVERNQPSLVSEIDPCLFLNKYQERNDHKSHRRCSSFPINNFRSGKIVYNAKVEGKLKPWRSMPNLLPKKPKPIVTGSRTVPSTPVHAHRIPTKNKISKRFKKVKRVVINNCDIVEHMPHVSTSLDTSGVLSDFGNLSFKSLPEMRYRSTCIPVKSPPEYGFVKTFSGQKDYKRKPKTTFIEDGGMSVLPMATGYFPRPSKGQSLTAFLTSSQFAHTNAELDRENAHFSISEAIISAVEQIRCRGDHLDESDEEIRDLKQRIRMRRRQKIKEKLLGLSSNNASLGVSPVCASEVHCDISSSSDEVDDLEIDEACNLTDHRGVSMSMASLYSEADIFKKPREAPDGASDILSAEGVALSLISKFNEKQLPRASDLEWLVSEEDAPQALLPMPKSFPISPDDSNEQPHTPLRGTQEWAPPRPQIIFTLHPRPNRKKLMAKQNYRCAGCGMKVATQYASKFRYCSYLGRYFCTGCHTNQLTFIPGCVLQKWDFTRYPVSNFSYRLLEQMFLDPLFRAVELNHHLLKLSKNFEMCRKYRNGLFYMKDFIVTCRFAETIQECLEHENAYIILDPEMYSMQDLINVRSGEMKSRLKVLVESCCRHTSECELCLARGFICEMCMAPKILFPWQFKTVTRCYDCGTCFHTTCWNKTNNTTCVRCQRISKRKNEVNCEFDDTPAVDN